MLQVDPLGFARRWNAGGESADGIATGAAGSTGIAGPRRKGTATGPESGCRTRAFTDGESGSVLGTAGRVLQGFEDRVQVEGGGLLPRGELLERLDLPRDESLHQVDEVGVRDQPIIVGIRVLVGPLEGVAPQVEDL